MQSPELNPQIFREPYAYLADVKESSVVITPIAASGSNRRYFRLSSPESSLTMIGAYSPNQAESKAFFHIDRKLNQSGIPVPTIHWEYADRTYYIISDNGRRSLYDLIEQSRTDHGFIDEPVMALCDEAMRLLVRCQLTGDKKIDYRCCYAPDVINSTSIKWDLYYFKYCFLKPILDDIDEEKLEKDFNLLAMEILNDENLTGFQYRDFQSRNLMVSDNDNDDPRKRLTLIDFQGGRHGMLLYDVASFVWQARANFTSEQRERLVSTYYEALKRHLTISGKKDNSIFDHKEFDRQLNLALTFRQLQTLGAYGFRGLIQHKARFTTCISQTLGLISSRIAEGYLRSFPAISEAITRSARKWSKITADREEPGVLTVRVTSFSYRDGGYPLDPTGNGGGFVFDCRWMHNPGRYDQFKSLTGLDSEVIDFLRGKGECDRFVEEALEMVTPAVRRYIGRGFTALSVAFGCTGGRHRSVYCADLFARRLRQACGATAEEMHIILNHSRIDKQWKL